MSPTTRLLVGALLAAVGLVGSVWLAPLASGVAADAHQVAATHEAQETPIDSVHGPWASDPLVTGVDQMAAWCASMMTAAGNGMMDGGMMDG